LSGGSRSRKTPYGPQEISVDGKQESRIKGQLRKYYQEIIKRANDADRILIFGPGEAKVELKREIEKSKPMAGKIKRLESADKMTARQITAKVRAFFKPYV
jgi:stalled ribosome rescue protein Dom34